MYDTARRVALVKQRVRENTRRRQRRGIYGLSAMCMLLFAALMQAAGTVVGPGQPEAWGVFGAMLLREDAGGYVLDARDWPEQHILHLVETVQYTKEAQA